MPRSPVDLQRAARDHLWLHFTRMGGYRDGEVPIIVRGEGCHSEDAWGVSRAKFEAYTLDTLAVVLVIGVLGYLVGASTRREEAFVPVAEPS